MGRLVLIGVALLFVCLAQIQAKAVYGAEDEQLYRDGVGRRYSMYNSKTHDLLQAEGPERRKKWRKINLMDGTFRGKRHAGDKRDGEEQLENDELKETKRHDNIDRKKKKAAAKEERAQKRDELRKMKEKKRLEKKEKRENAMREKNEQREQAKKEKKERREEKEKQEKEE